MRRMFIVVLAGMMLSCIPSAAQRFSVSTNLLGYACLGTLNADVSLSVSQNWSLTAGVKYNPFTFGADDPENQMQLRQRAFSFGARMWPWHNASGWWLAGKLRYQEYNLGGILTRETEEGDKAGFGMYAGYTLMVSRHFNVEFGLGLWSGAAWYKKYSCQSCGLTIENGRKWFLHPDDLMISLAYVF